MKLFTIGPTQMYETTFVVRNRQIPYFRTTEFSELIYETNDLLKNFMKTSKESSVIYLTASGTGGMEATVMNCFNEDDKILVIVGGNFGQRFADICRIHELNYDVLKVENNESLKKSDFDRFRGQGYTGLLVNLHETSTGQLYDIDIIKEFCQQEGAYLIVDAIGTFLCDEFAMDDNNIDAVLISTQKGLCVSPGMALVVLNKKIVENKINKNQVKNMYFDFKDYIYNMGHGQTPFTPAVGVIFEINDMLKYIRNNGGVEKHLAIIEERAIHFRKLLKENGLTYPETYTLSNAETPVQLNVPIAKKIFEELKDKYNLFVNPVGGQMQDYMLRIAHIGNLQLEDYDELITKIMGIINKNKGSYSK